MPEVIYSVGSTSSSSTYGNVIEFVHHDVLSKFPPNFFNYEHISTTMAFRQMKRYTDNSEQEIRKQVKPVLVIKPSFEAGDDSIPFNKTLLTWNVQSNPEGISRRSILPFIYDPHRGYRLGYRMNRDKLVFDITVQLNTLSQQLDIFKFLENSIGFGNPYSTIASLESVIPFQMVQYISQIIQMPISQDDPSSIPPVMQYVQKWAHFPVTYKLRNATSRPEFFMYYDVPVMITYNDLSIDDGSRKGMADDVYSITFRVITEFNHPAAFLLMGGQTPQFRQMKFAMDVSDPTSDSFIPIYTMNRAFDNRENLFDGYRLYTMTVFKTEEENSGKDDAVDLREVIEPQYYPIIRKYSVSGIPHDILFRFKIFMNNRFELDREDYDLDWTRMELVVHNSDPSATYRMMVFANSIRCNEELVQEAEAKKNDKTYEALYNPKNLADYTPEISANINNPFKS